MSNPEQRPQQLTCTSAVPEGAGVEVMAPREVPLGGPRAMTVRRTLPQRQRSLIGAWCFLDHYGPDPVAQTGGMKVAPHPHTGLQTVSWLFEGEIEHRDSAGNHALVRPGEVNLMTAGRGISHSEVSTATTTDLHGAQLWVALPDESRHTDPGFEHYAPPEVAGDGWRGRVFLGTLLGETSPVTTYTPLLGAEVVLDPGVVLPMEVDASFEHGVLVDLGSVVVDGVTAGRADLAYAPPGDGTLVLTAGDEGARVLVIGGPPFGEAIVMWWNFVGRTHEEVVGYREEWQAQVLADDGAAGAGGAERSPGQAGGLREEGEQPLRVVEDAQQVRPGRFGVVAGDHLAPIPAPVLPNARLRERS
ncbi:pirin family protein [Nocardioides sp. TF02-7]|uniref:pirin family protein n=1 Tax=Nocardioides sp. TF02-7 TaxID=2917724 RepID=UPI001F056B3D|nr:pirin family protein [Nocardioides sp. TF02-7]UMG93799.1 pirin family protein [Nocardioides sp. TF02-7]